jgi:N6-L-threonylcarbamoyladenine synthase
MGLVPTLLAIETSCDETSAAIIRDGQVLSNIVSSQVRLHAEYGGVVPELAAREHLRLCQPVVLSALQQAAVASDQLDAIAATRGPGLPNALMIGCRAAQAMAFALRRPFFGIHHHEAHLYSPWVAAESGRDPAERPLRSDFQHFQPNVSLIVSGGHTMLIHVRAELEHQLLGATLDDAAGECFDKVAKLIGLPYPGGPEMDTLAADGNPRAYDFPRPLLRAPGDDFSFAGLKTSVRYFLQRHDGLADDPQKRRDLCASVQAAIVETLVGKTMRAALRLKVPCVTASGGVTCNRALRRQLGDACAQAGLNLRLAAPSLCTDNAAMIGLLAERKLLRASPPTPLDTEIEPGWNLATASP